MINDAEQRLALDLRICDQKWKHGDIVSCLTWLITTGDPCLVLVPLVPNERAMPYVVPMSTCWVWDEAIGDKAQAKQLAQECALCLGFPTHNLGVINRILGAVRDHLGDLVNAPVLSREHQSKTAEMEILDNETGKTREVEVFDHV